MSYPVFYPPASSTLYIPFASYGADGESLTLTGLAVTDIEIYKNGSITQRASDSGYTLLDTDGIDFDGLTGIHGFSIDLSDNTDSGFYAVGSTYWVIVSAVTINAQTVTFIAAVFTIRAAESVTGKPAVDTQAWNGTAVATPTVAGVPEVDVTHWLGTAAATPTVAGVPEVDATHWRGTALPAEHTAGYPVVTIKDGTGTGEIDTTSGGVAVASIANDAITAAAIADAAIDVATFAAGAITASALAADAGAEIADAVWDEARAGHVAAGSFGEYVPANVTTWLGTAAASPHTAGYPVVTIKDGTGTGEIDTTSGGVAVASIAAGAITAAAIAADAIGASELATDAVDEIADAVLAAIAAAGVSAGAADAFNATDVDICNMALDLLKEAPIDSLTDGTPEANWLSRNYSMSRDAELRDHPWKFAVRRRQLYPLDFVFDDGMTGTLSGAWGLIRLTPHWSGVLAKIRRSSDDTTDDFTNGDDVLAVDVDAISTFVGTGSGYIDTLYDQSGNGRDLSQATTTKQPLYDAEAGNTDVPAMAFDGTDDHLATSAALSAMMSTSVGYMIVVGLVDTWTLDSATASANHVLAGDNASEMGLTVRKGGRMYGVNDDGSEDSTTDAVPLAEPFVAEWRHTGGTLYTRVNKGTERSTTSGVTTSLAGVLNVGDDTAGSQALDGTVFAILTFSTIPSDAERDRMVERLMRWVGAAGAKSFSSDWAYRYPVPSNCLRMLHLRTNGAFEGTPVKHELEDGYILTNEATVYARYVEQFTDSARFDPLFTEALSAKLAFKAAHWVTGKATMAQTVKALYDDAIVRAKRANAFESGTAERVFDDDVIDTRYAVGGDPDRG